MKKYLLSLLLVTIFLSNPAPITAGNDLTVTCLSPNTNCSITPKNTPLFSEKNVKPGDNFYASLTIRNSTAATCSLYFEIEKTNRPVTTLDSVIKAQITKNNSSLYTNNLASIIGATAPIMFDKLPAATTNLYDWKLTMDPTAGNLFQANQLMFKLPLLFRCDKQPDANPTPVPIPSPRPIPNNTWWTLTITPNCTTTPNTVRWTISSHANFDVPFTWQVFGGYQKGIGIVPALSNVSLQIPKSTFIQLLIISWGNTYFGYSLNPGINCQSSNFNAFRFGL